ncbi:MAG: hypothetical protein COS57_12000 [Syntrophobacterales bacterium CG03_land_8_20_14_0_80_58_14]|nr:MAG: hypothetical protein COS57_12000 [Syntrophobacterales bacterium CG03_land_8_20_14_0_80_58_14]
MLDEARPGESGGIRILQSAADGTGCPLGHPTEGVQPQSALSVCPASSVPPAGGADPINCQPRAGFPKSRTTTTAPPAHSLSLLYERQ